MKAHFAKPLPFHKSLGFTIGFILSISALILLVVPPGWAPRCGFAYWMGLPCPTCGVTRSLHLIMQGHLTDAFMIQPFFFIFAAAFFGWFVHTWTAITFKWRSVRIELESRKEKLGMLLLAGLLITGNWIYLMLAH